MKKITLLIVALFFATVSFAQRAERVIPQALTAQKNRVAMDFVSSTKALKTAEPFAKNMSAPSVMKPKMQRIGSRKAPKRAESIADIYGEYCMIYYDCFNQDRATSCVVTISEGDNENEVLIDGWGGSWANTLTATVDLEEGTVTIPTYQTIYQYEGDNDGIFVAFDEDDEGYVDSYVGFIDGEGIYFGGGMWGVLVDQDADTDQFYAKGYYAILEKTNGVMKFTYSGKDYVIPVRIYQTDDYDWTIVNFANEGATIDLELGMKNTFEIATQYLCTIQYFDFYTYGLTSTNGIGSPTITGTGDDKVLTFDSNWTGYTPGYWLGAYSNTTIELTSDEIAFEYPEFVDTPATPATPSIDELRMTDFGAYITFTIPPKDVNGTSLPDRSQLFYTIYSRTKNDGIVPITFTSETHTELEEAMTEIPYGFTDNYDFFSDALYLNELYDENWVAIGIQSIYYGGGETNASEIFWYYINPIGIEDITMNSAVVKAYTDGEISYRAVPAKNFWGFENRTLLDWMTLDADGDGNTWSISKGAKTNFGDYCVSSASYLNKPLTPDNWLISPQVELGGTMVFYAAGQDANWAGEVFAVYACTEETFSPENAVPVTDEITATSTMTKYTVDLSNFSGVGYVAIRHFNVTDMFRLNVDDIMILAKGEEEFVLTPMTFAVEEGSIVLDDLESNTLYDFFFKYGNGKTYYLPFQTLDSAPTGIATMNTEGKVRYFDLMGRTANKSSKGVVIKQTNENGTLKTVKVVK